MKNYTVKEMKKRTFKDVYEEYMSERFTVDGLKTFWQVKLKDATIGTCVSPVKLSISDFVITKDNKEVIKENLNKALIDATMMATSTITEFLDKVIKVGNKFPGSNVFILEAATVYETLIETINLTITTNSTVICELRDGNTRTIQRHMLASAKRLDIIPDNVKCTFKVDDDSLKAMEDHTTIVSKLNGVSSIKLGIDEIPETAIYYDGNIIIYKPFYLIYNNLIAIKVDENELENTLEKLRSHIKYFIKNPLTHTAYKRSGVINLFDESGNTTATLETFENVDLPIFLSGNGYSYNPQYVIK